MTDDSSKTGRGRVRGGVARMAATLLATAALLAAANSAKAVKPQTESAARDDCGANAEAGMAECLAKKAARAHRSLKAADAAARAAIERWDEDETYRAEALARLDAADRAFEAYRVAECGFHRALGGGAIGNALDIRRSACEVEMDTTRAAQLERLAGRIRPR